MKISSFHVSTAAAIAVALSSGIAAAAAPVDRRGLLDLDLGLCAGLNLLGLVTIGIDKDGCKPTHSEENPHPGNSHVCRTLRARNIEPRDLFVQCVDEDFRGWHPGYPGWGPPGYPGWEAGRNSNNVRPQAPPFPQAPNVPPY